MSEINPTRLSIEASSSCQLKCPSCPTNTKEIHPNIGTGYLQLSDFKKLIYNNRHIQQVELSNYGEMFLNPNLLDILQYAHLKGVALTARNGVNLNTVSDEVLEGLVKYKFRSLTCSIDGASEETYKNYRVNGRFTNVLRNISRINQFKEKYNSKYPKLKWQFIVFGHNEHEIEKAKNLADGLQMQFKVKLSWDSKFSPIKNEKYLRKLHSVASRVEYEQRYNSVYMSQICYQLWNQPQINWDGKTLGCTRNFWGDFGGNAFQDGLTNSLNNKKLKYARNMLKGIRDERDDIPCSTCNIYIKRKQNKSWVKDYNIIIDKILQRGFSLSIQYHLPLRVRMIIKKIILGPNYII